MANPVLVAQISPNPVNPINGITVNTFSPTYNIAPSSITSVSTAVNYRYASDPQLIGTNLTVGYSGIGTFVALGEQALIANTLYETQLPSIPSVSLTTTYRYVGDPQLIGTNLNVGYSGIGTYAALAEQAITNTIIANYSVLPVKSLSFATNSVAPSTPYVYSSNTFTATGVNLSVRTNYALGANIMGSGVANASGPSYVVVAEKTIAVQSYDTANGNPIVNFYYSNIPANPTNYPVMSVPVSFQATPPVLNGLNLNNINYIPLNLSLYTSYNNGVFNANNLPTYVSPTSLNLPVYTNISYPTALNTIQTATVGSASLYVSYNNGLLNANNLPAIADYSTGLLLNYKPLSTLTSVYSLLSPILNSNQLSLTTAYYGTGGNFDPKSPFLGGTTAYWS